MTGLQVIARDIRACTLCPLAKSRTHAVPGGGPVPARLMFIGEAPGRQEDVNGAPFVGRAGKLLNDALVTAGIKRNQVFITNVVKCRPPNNRLPMKNEVQVCVTAHLNRQIRSVNPEIICLLGATAVKALLGSTGPISAIRGRLILKDHKYLATYHPAAAGRNPLLLRIFQSDIKELKNFLREISKPLNITS
jgi:uracil-DNA glycosylase family 4